MCVRLLWCPRCVSVGRDALALGGVAAFVGLSGCVPFVRCPPRAGVGPSGVCTRVGGSPFVCGFPSRSHILVLWVTALLGEGSPGLSARARARVSFPGPFVSVRVLPGDSMGVPGPRGWPPLLVTTPLRGVRVPSARGRVSRSRDLRLERRPPGWASSGVAARAPGLSPVEYVICCVRVFARERPLVFCALRVRHLFSWEWQPSPEAAPRLPEEESARRHSASARPSPAPLRSILARLRLMGTGDGGPRRVWPAAA